MFADRTSEIDLDPVDLHDVLSNERRQYILEVLYHRGRSVSVGDLSERIAEIETEESPPPQNIRQSVYVSIHQTHLPKLDDLGIVNYDAESKAVELNQLGEQVYVYTESVPKYGLSSSEYYLGLSILGFLLIIAGEVGVPVLADIGSVTLAAATFVLLLVSAAYDLAIHHSSILHRL